MRSATFPYQKKHQKVLGQEMAYVEAMLPRGLFRQLTAEEMEHYRCPEASLGAGRRPILSWPRQLPIEGLPADVAHIVNSYAEWLTYSQVSKLFVNAEPGAALTGTQREFCRTWAAQTEVTVRGLHYLQEDAPHEIGQAITA